MEKERGQSLIELMIAMGLFTLWVSGVAFLILDVYASDKVARGNTIATMLAQEGLEAVRSIRDAGWERLDAGEYGLDVSDGRWVFEGSQDEVPQLANGTRIIRIEDLEEGRKKVTAQVIWEISNQRVQDIELVTYLTNWKEVVGAQTCETYCSSLQYTGGTCRRRPHLCSVHGEVYEEGGDIFCSGQGAEIVCCCY